MGKISGEEKMFERKEGRSKSTIVEPRINNPVAISYFKIWARWNLLYALNVCDLNQACDVGQRLVLGRRALASPGGEKLAKCSDSYFEEASMSSAYEKFVLKIHAIERRKI
jgi:hypothetical protein